MNIDDIFSKFDRPVTELIRQRTSCRAYLEQPMAGPVRRHLDEFISALPEGPLGTQPRFSLVTATEADRNALRSLGTYGFIRGATGFIIGAAIPEGRYLEDFGYLMEAIILSLIGVAWSPVALGSRTLRNSS